MMTKELTEQQAQGQKCIARAREIYDAAQAADRDMSPTELADYNAEVAAAGDWLKQSARQRMTWQSSTRPARLARPSVTRWMGARWLAAWAAWPARTAG